MVVAVMGQKMYRQGVFLQYLLGDQLWMKQPITVLIRDMGNCIQVLVQSIIVDLLPGNILMKNTGVILYI